MEYKHRDVRVSTSAGDLASDCPQSEKIRAEKRTMWSPKVCDQVYSLTCVTFFVLTSHPLTIMSQFQSCLDKFRGMTDAGSLLHLNAWRSFHQATERLNGLAGSVPNDKDELAEDQEIWVEVFCKAMVSQSYSMIAAADATFG